MGRGRGRPPRADGPAFDTDEVMRIYRDGVVVEDADGKIELTFPGPTEIAEQLGVSASTISRFAKKHGLDEIRRARLAELGGALPPDEPPTRRPQGRPRKGDEPNVDWDQVARDYVEGIPHRRGDGSTAIVFVTHADLARRYKVSEASVFRALAERNASSRRERNLDSLPMRVEVAPPTTPDKAMTLLGSANANLIEGGRLLSQQWVDNVRAGEVRANDPVVVEKGIRMALDAEAREAGIGTSGAMIQVPVEYLERARRALERRAVPLDPMLTGIVIDTTTTSRDREGSGDEPPQKSAGDN
jgi:hypothetical protein